MESTRVEGTAKRKTEGRGGRELKDVSDTKGNASPSQQKASPVPGGIWRASPECARRRASGAVGEPARNVEDAGPRGLLGQPAPNVEGAGPPGLLESQP